MFVRAGGFSKILEAVALHRNLSTDMGCSVCVVHVSGVKTCSKFQVNTCSTGMPRAVPKGIVVKRTMQTANLLVTKIIAILCRNDVVLCVCKELQ